MSPLIIKLIEFQTEYKQSFKTEIQPSLGDHYKLYLV